MGLFDYGLNNFNPYQGGLLGALGNNDLASLAQAYGGFKPPWQNTPPDPLNGDQSGSAPIGSAPQNPYGAPNSLMPAFTSTVSTEGQPPQQPFFHIVPGSFADKLFGQPQMAANAAPAQPMQGSGAEPSAVWGGVPPQMANVPMPLPRPAPGVNLGESAPPPNIPPPANAPSPPVQAQQPPALAPQAQPAPQAPPFMQSFRNKMQTMAGLLDPSQRPELKETGTDLNTGQKTFALFNPVTGQMSPVSGQGTGQPGQNNGFLAPGVSYLNSNATGDEYLKQWSPEVQSAAKAYLAGNIVPTGNPRANALASKAKEVAIKYSNDMGIPFSDARYAEMRKFRTELGSTQANTVGGQTKAFNQGIEHMSVLAGTLEKLDNSNGLGIPLIADAINTGRQLTSTEQAAISDKARSIGQTLAGEVGKLFSGSAGGGVEERRMTRDRFDTVKSPKQLAAALEATLDTMRGGLAALEQRRDQVLGPNGADVKFVEPETQKKIAQIESAIARMKGEQPAAPAASGWSVKKL